MPRANARSRAATKPAEDEVFEEIDELEEVSEDDDLEELDEPEETKPTRGRATKKAAPAAKKTAAKVAPRTETSEYDSNWLASYITEETGVEYDSRGVRMLLRKLAKDGSLDREIGTDRQRYVFPKGPNDITVKAVIKMVKSGEAAAVKREGLDKVKERATPAKKAAPVKKAAAPAAKATTRRRRSAE